MDTDKKTITRDEFQRIKRLWEMAMYHASALEGAEIFLADFLPAAAMLRMHNAIYNREPVLDFLRRHNVRIQIQQKPTKGTKK